MGSGRGAGSCCAKGILIFTNVVFFIIGLMFFSAGIAIKFADGFIQPYVDKILTNLPTLRSAASPSFTVSSTGGVTIDLSALTGDFSISFISVGLIVMLVAVLGMCGACCASKKLLILYLVIFFILIVAQVAVIVVIATGVLNAQIKGQLKQIVSAKYGGIDKFDPETLFLNFIMLQFSCCGVDGYSDFDQTTRWARNRTLNITTPEVAMVNIQLITPIACCKMDAPFPLGKPLNDTCAYQPTDLTNNWNKGCFSEMTTLMVTNYEAPLIGGVSGVLAFELMLAVIAIVVTRSAANKSDIEIY